MIVAQAAPSPAPTPVPAASAAPATAEPGVTPIVASTPSAAIAARARLVFEQIRANAIDHSLFTSAMDAKLDARGLDAVSAEFRALGAIASFNQSRRISHGTASVYVFRIVCEHPPVLEEAIGFAADGKIDYLAFSPVGRPPAQPTAAPQR